MQIFAKLEEKNAEFNGKRNFVPKMSAKYVCCNTIFFRFGMFAYVGATRVIVLSALNTN